LHKIHKNFLRLNKNFNDTNLVYNFNLGDDSKTSYEYDKIKIDYFKLDNIILIKGNFKETVPNYFDSPMPQN
jgi:hypothetical protein